MLLKINFEKSCPSEKFFPPDEGVELAICGRSNSGKSSILNMLANQKKLAKTSNTPCLLYTSPSPRDGIGSRMPSSA